MEILDALLAAAVVIFMALMITLTIRKPKHAADVTDTLFIPGPAEPQNGPVPAVIPVPTPVIIPEPAPAPLPPEEPTEPVIPPLSLYYEAMPFTLTQRWGILDPETYGKYGYSRHSGIDILHGYNRRLRAPFAFRDLSTYYQKGGGNVLSIVSSDEYLGPDGKPAHVRVQYLHLDRYITTRKSGKTGELLCIAGNTGDTTGPHTHIEYTWVRRIGGVWKEIEKNDANNSFNPLPFYNGQYAVNA